MEESENQKLIWKLRARICELEMQKIELETELERTKRELWLAQKHAA